MIRFVYGVIELPCKVVTWKIDASILRWTTITLARLFSWTSLGIRCVNPRGLDAGQRNPGGYSQMRSLRIQDPRSIYPFSFKLSRWNFKVSSFIVINYPSIKGYWKPLFRVEQTVTLTFSKVTFIYPAISSIAFTSGIYWYTLKKICVSHSKFRRHCRSLKYDRAINGRFIYRV